MTRLDAELHRLGREAPCLASAGAPGTVGELLDRARALRGEMPQLRGCAVALCALSPARLIEALVALDGFAGRLLLLPAGTGRDLRQQLVASAGCGYTLEEAGLGATAAGPTAPGSCAAPTRWLLATSGTTGTPKLISHTLGSLTRSMQRDPGRGAAYTWGLMYDPCRFAGLQVVLQALLGGSRLALPSALDFEAQLSALVAQRVNALSATPSLWRKMLMDGRVLELPLRQITLGGESADQPLLDRLRLSFPKARLVQIYASTEAGAAFAVKDGRAGFPAAWLENDAAPLPLRVSPEGELLIKPAELPSGQEIAQRLDRDGFLASRDLVRVDGDRVHFLGRSSGAINVGGNKVHPEEVEQVIRALPQVCDVRVFGTSSSIMGQLVAAEVVAAAQTDGAALRRQIQEHCRTQLKPWQCPALITLVQGLRETAAGKRERISR